MGAVLALFAIVALMVVILVAILNAAFGGRR